jgi:predicted amidophosphoribosyltransferase
MPTCPSCNADIDESANYCPNCGDPIEEVSLPAEIPGGDMK